jgi:hypothetical protein
MSLQAIFAYVHPIEDEEMDEQGRLLHGLCNMMMNRKCEVYAIHNVLELLDIPCSSERVSLKGMTILGDYVLGEVVGKALANMYHNQTTSASVSVNGTMVYFAMTDETTYLLHL